MVNNSRNDPLILHLTVEEKKDELSTAKKNLNYSNIGRYVAGVSAVGFGGTTAYLYNGEMHIGLAAIGITGLWMASYVYEFTKVNRIERKRVSDLEIEVSILMKNPAYKSMKRK